MTLWDAYNQSLQHTSTVLTPSSTVTAVDTEFPKTVEYFLQPTTTARLVRCGNPRGESAILADGSTDHGGQIDTQDITNVSTCEVGFSKSYVYPPFCVVTSEVSGSQQPYALPPLDISTTSSGFTVSRKGGVNLEEKINYVCAERGK